MEDRQYDICVLVGDISWRESCQRECRHGGKISYKSIRDVYVLHKSVLMGVDYELLECLADQMRFLKKLLDIVRLLAIFERMPLHSFMAWTRSTFPG